MIAAMEAHRADIDGLFAGVGPDLFKPPDYVWADVNRDRERERRERDREEMAGSCWKSGAAR